MGLQNRSPRANPEIEAIHGFPCNANMGVTIRRTMALFCWYLLSFALAGKALASGTPSLPGLTSGIAVLTDDSFALSLDDILTPQRQKEFRPVASGNFNFGFRKTAIWIKLSLRGTADARGILSVTSNFLDFVDIYVAPPGKGSETADFSDFQGGDHRPPPMNGISSLDNAASVIFKAGKQTEIYIRIANTNSSTLFSLRLEDAEGHDYRVLANGAVYGLWFGGMGILCLTQLVFFYFVRRAEYPLLALSTFGVILIYFGNLGFSHAYLFGGAGAANDAFIGFNAWAGMAASAVAYNKILRTRRRAPWLNKALKFCALFGLVGAGLSLAGYTAQFGPYGSTLSIVGVALVTVESLRQWRSEGVASRMRAAAFCVMAAGATLGMLSRLGLDLFSNWTFHAYGLAVLIQTLLLTSSLAVRLRDVENRNRVMQAQALRSAQTAERIAAQRVEERTRELVEARHTAEEALQAEMQSQLLQVRFLEVISHQYRTPLAAIRSSIDSIALALPAHDAKNHDRINLIRRSISRLVELLEANLIRSRLQGPSFRPRMATIKAGSIVLAAHQRVQDQLNDTEIQLVMSEDAHAVTIHADAEMLEIAIINVLENAVKYTSLQGRGAITLSFQRQGSHAVIAVADQGIGIPAQELPHVFGNMVRGSNARTVEGSGLGLFLVARIIEAHGGSVEADSVEGKGTTIRMILPIAFNL